MLPDNNWYGHRRILLEFLGIKDKKIFASLKHGWSSQVLDISPNKKRLYFYTILFWNKFQSNFLKKKKIYNVRAIGSPFLYLCKMLETKYDGSNTKPNSTERVLVFPTHSSQGFVHVTNHKLLIKQVEKAFKGPYTVCLYYFNLNKKDILLYKRKNWKVVCCVKNKTDQLSLFKLYNEINMHEIIVSTEFSSALFYGMYLKKKTKVLLAPNKRVSSYIPKEKQFLKFYMKKYPELFKKHLSPEKGHELAKAELGFNCLKNKKQLREILGLNSPLKNFFANIFSFLYDIKYSSGLRTGKNLKKKYLKKYISAARDDKDIYK